MNESLNGYSVEVNPHLSQAIQKFAFFKGIFWGDGQNMVQYTNNKYLITELRGSKIVLVRSDVEYGNYKKVDCLEFCNILDKYVSPPPPITIGDNVVTEVDGGIKVGCQFVSDDQIKQIYKMRFEK